MDTQSRLLHAVDRDVVKESLHCGSKYIVICTSDHALHAIHYRNGEVCIDDIPYATDEQVARMVKRDNDLPTIKPFLSLSVMKQMLLLD